MPAFQSRGLDFRGSTADCRFAEDQELQDEQVERLLVRGFWSSFGPKKSDLRRDHRRRAVIPTQTRKS